MSKPPFFICPPRTRSTLVCELTYEYVKSKYNLLKLKHHNELFTEFNHATLVNKNPTELIPFLKNDKKNDDNKINFILLKNLGKTVLPNQSKLSIQKLKRLTRAISQY